MIVSVNDLCFLVLIWKDLMVFGLYTTLALMFSK